MSNKITIAKLWAIEHEILSEASVWDRADDSDIIRLAYYNDGVQTAINRVLLEITKADDAD